MTNFLSLLCLLLVLSGLLVAFSKSPIQSMLALILIFCNAATILLMFNVEFIGLIYIIIYVGAIAVLFLFVVMMLNVKYPEKEFFKLLKDRFGYAIIGLFLLYVIGIMLFVMFKEVFKSSEFLRNIINSQFLIDNLYNVDVLGQVLYNYYVITFLVAGLILLVALIGATFLTLRFNKNKYDAHKKQKSSKQLSRSDKDEIFFG